MTKEIPTYAGKNLAPLKPLQRAKETDSVERNYVSDALRDKYKAKMSENKDTWRELISVGQMIALFIHGKQTLIYNPFAYTYVPIQLKPADVVKARGGMNVTQFYSTKHTQQWLASNPDIIVHAMGNDDRNIAAAKAADILLDHYERKLYTKRFNKEEAVMMQCFGTAVNRIRFDHNQQGAKVLQQVLGEEEFEFGGYAACEDCQFSGSPQDFQMIAVAEGVDMPMCPECKSFATTYEEPMKQVIPVVQGSKMVNHGDIRCDLVPIPAIRWDIRGTVDESSWAIIEQNVSVGVVERLFGSKVRLGEAESENQFGLDVMKALVEMGGTAVARQDKNKHEVTVTEMFLSPEDMTDIDLRGGEMTVSGEELPAGKMSEIFPEGACVVGLNGLSVITGIYGETHKDQLSSGVYHVKPLSGLGKGLNDMVESQKRLNKLDTQNLEYMQGMATPAVLYAKGVISGEDMKYLGHPKANIPIDLAKFPGVNRLSELVHALPPGNAGAQFFEYTYSTLQNFIQLQSHVTDFSDGLPGVNNKTATGAQISQTLSQSLFQPLLAGKCDLRLGNAKNIVKAFVKHFPMPKYFGQKFKGQNRITKGVWLSQSDVCGDFEYEVVQDSEAPKSQFVKRQELMEVFNGIFGGYENYLMAKQNTPEEVNAILRLYDIDLEADDYDEIGEICRERWEQAKSLTEEMVATMGMLGMQFDPSIVPVSIPSAVRPTELHQDKKSGWFRQFLDTDEGRNLSPELAQVVDAFVGLHFQNVANEQAILAQAAGQAQAAMEQPVMEQQMAQAEQQMAMDAERMQMEQAKAEQDIANQMESEKVKVVSKEMQNQMDSERDAQKLETERAKFELNKQKSELSRNSRTEGTPAKN